MENHIVENPIPNTEKPIFINEPWLIDRSLSETEENDEDSFRVYIPMDISCSSILRRLAYIIKKYGEVSFWNNESDYSCEVYALVSQIEIYDQYWSSHGMSDGKHSKNTAELVRLFVDMLKEIPEGDGERFPYEIINTLEQEYLN